MPRRRRRPPIPITLSLPAEPPTREETNAILMATDAVIGQAGRAGVVLILNGSRSQKVKRWDWDKLPEHGLLSHLTAKEIGPKVDWCIHHGWLRIEVDREGIPLLFHTEKGWPRVKQLWLERILGWFADWQEAGRPEMVWPRLEHVNRQIKHSVLEEIERQQRADLAAVLRAWFPHEVRKVRQAINRTLQALQQPTLRNW
jgi:superfamily II DNA helicase RecQ